MNMINKLLTWAGYRNDDIPAYYTLGASINPADPVGGLYSNPTFFTEKRDPKPGDFYFLYEKELASGGANCYGSDIAFRCGQRQDPPSKFIFNSDNRWVKDTTYNARVSK